MESVEEKMWNALIDKAVNRFLGWKLPADFGPDCGISFDPVSSKGTQWESRREPIGTNLLTAAQAKSMLEHCLVGIAERISEVSDDWTQALEERDHMHDIIDKLCDAVLGPDRHEWSSAYFFEDAVREVEDRMAALATPQQHSMDVLVEVYKTWPVDIRKKLSWHDLRRMSGWVPHSLKPEKE